MQPSLVSNAVEERTAFVAQVAVHHDAANGCSIEFAIEHRRQIHLGLHAWIVALLEHGEGV